jgi:hypothetical protein
MRTETRWWRAAGGILFGLFFAHLAPERGHAASDPGSEAAHEFESRDEDVAAAPGARQDPPPVELSVPSNWQIYTGRSSISGDVTVQLVTSSENQIEDKGATFRPTLVLRCEGRELEVSVVTGLPTGRLHDSEDEHSVSIRFGESPAREIRVRSRFERRVLLLDHPADLIREMLDNQRLVFSFISVSQWLAPRITEMSFDLSGLGDVAPELNESCSL